MTFYTWLRAQQGRSDNTGRYAEIVYSDPQYPQTTQRLYAVLRYHTKDLVARRLARFAHREWRTCVRSNGNRTYLKEGSNDGCKLF